MLKTAKIKKIKLISAILLIIFLLLTFITYFSLNDIPDTLQVTTSPLDKILITDKHGTPLYRTYQNRWNVTGQIELHDIPKFLRTVFIFVEDKRYFKHKGVDWLARFSALIQSIKARKVVRGASTISEQVVRILHPRSRNLWSKWLEGFEAYQLERKFSKGEILNFYLNQVPYARNLRGVGPTALYYFNRDLDTLNKKEMLTLATLVRSPGRWDPKKNIRIISKTVDRTAYKLASANMISEDDLHEILAEKLSLQDSPLPVDASHFVQKLATDKKIMQSVKNGILTTTIDAGIQKKVKDILDRQINKLKDKDVHNGATLVVDLKNNEILAWVVSGKFSQESGSQIDSIMTPRQPGSTLKPFVYAIALEKGWTAATVIDDAPITEGINSGVHQYRNFSRVFYGPIRLRLALGNSLNTPVVRTTNFITENVLLDKLHQLGFKNLQKSADFYGNGLALGNGEVSLYELVRAYAVFAENGVYQDFISYHSKNIFARKQNKRQKIFSPETSAIISDILADPEARRLEFGHYGLLQFPEPIAVKTGTSNDFKDAWSIGYNQNWVVGVWMGNLTRQPMQEVSGAVGPVAVLRSIFGELLRNPHQSGFLKDVNLKHATICADTGLLASQKCPKVDEIFILGTVPTKKCDGQHKQKKSNEQFEIAYPLTNSVIALDPRIPDKDEAIEFKLSPLPKAATVHWILNNNEIATVKSRTGKYLWHCKKGRYILLATIDFDDNSISSFTREIEFRVK